MENRRAIRRGISENEGETRINIHVHRPRLTQ
jgi:hypothetical protein